jgi:hypothetical protein
MLTLFVLVVILRSNPLVFQVIDVYDSPQACESQRDSITEKNDMAEGSVQCFEFVDQSAKTPKEPKPLKDDVHRVPQSKPLKSPLKNT